MTAAHMGMVFDAEGLDGSEKLLLAAYCNRTDDHGYCWPGQKRLADDCGTSPATVKRAKASLIKKGLIASVRRVDPRTGQPIPNLTRVNLALLEAMARPKRAYDDNVIERLTFDPLDEDAGLPQKRKRAGKAKKQESGSDLLMVQNEPSPDLLRAQSEPDPGSDCIESQLNLSPTRAQDEPLTLSHPSKNPHLSRSPADTPVPADSTRKNEREDPQQDEAPPASPTPAAPAGSDGAPPSGQDPAELVVAAYAEARPGVPVSTASRAKVRAGARALLAQGHPADRLCELAADMATRGAGRWTDLVQHAERNARLLALPAPRPPLPDGDEWCKRHRGARLEHCGCGREGAAVPPGQIRALLDQHMTAAPGRLPRPGRRTESPRRTP